MIRIFAVTLLLALPAVHARAENLSDVDKDLQQVEENLKENKGAADELSTNLKKTKAELGKLKIDTQSLVKKVRTAETEASKARSKLDILQAERARLDREMTKLKRLITPMLKAGLDMARRPTDLNLFFADPAEAESMLTAQTALSGAARTTQNRLVAYAEVKQKLGIVEQQVAAQQAKLDGVLTQLDGDREKLTERMKEREKLAKTTESELGEKAETIKELTKKRQSLVALMSSLRREDDDRRAAARTRKKARKSVIPVPKSERTLARGLPASGYIVQRFGEADADSGLAGRGVRIEGEPGGLVTAPRNGEVRFNGPFKGFGTLVIIEHENGDFSLLSGLGRATVREGQKIAKGEPVGTLSASTSPKPELYYELRHDGSPVDPLKLF
jgi:septal ring factor EnvC (AmiA/AmiB activator)